MALEGDVKEFGLADVIQLIASSQKTGVIFLDRAEEQVSISFKDGSITGAIYRKGGRQDQFHEFLFRAKKLDQETVRKVLQIQNDTGLSVDEILIKEYLMTREEVEAAITTKIQEVIDDVFTWRDAHYRFDSDAGLYSHSRSRVTISAEPLLMEAMRRKDEWPMITRSIPSDETVLEKAGEMILPDEIEPDARKLHNIFQERHKVAELVEMSGMGRFRTYAAAHALVQLGALKKAEAPRLAARPEPAKAGSPGVRIGAEIFCGLASLLLLAAAVWLAAWQWPKPSAGDDLVGRNLKRQALEAARDRVEAFRYRRGYYPDSLGQAVKPEEAAGLEYQRLDSLDYRLDLGR